MQRRQSRISVDLAMQSINGAAIKRIHSNFDQTGEDSDSAAFVHPINDRIPSEVSQFQPL